MAYQSWRQYQQQIHTSNLNKKQPALFIKPKKSKKFLKFFSLTIIFFLILIVVEGLVSTARFSNNVEYNINFNKDISYDFNDIGLIKQEKKLWSKQDVKSNFPDLSFLNNIKNEVTIKKDEEKYIVKTSLNSSLQEYMLKKLRRSNTRNMGLVIMEPDSGRILSMIGYNKFSDEINPCIEKSFPAASIFKIITAAAAIEICGMDPKTELYFNGRKHTLYKRQLREKKNKYTNKITLKDSFAQSVNPVFGKIGALYLGKNVIDEYASGFAFNKEINFELPVCTSVINVTEKPYQQAEIASGFNRNTQISPLHGALISCAILNNGNMPEPTIIDKIVNDNGDIVYKNEYLTINQAISPKTCDKMKILMEETVKSGTVKKAFRRAKRDKILKRLNIGGKTGSINSNTHNVRYDWFVGFAEEKNGANKVAISVIVAHDKYIGIRSFQYARYAFRKYFQDIEKDNNYAKR